MKNNVFVTTAALAGSLALGGAQTQAADEGGWNFSVAPMYLWAKSIEAHASAGGKTLPLELDFQDEILENLDAAFAIHFEAKSDKWGFIFEYNFARLDPTTEIEDLPVDVRSDVEFEDVMIEGAVTYTFTETGSTEWEVLGGLRYYDQDVDVEITTSGPGLAPLPSELNVGDSWVQPFVGLRTTTKLSERWSLRARADYGYEHSENKALHGILFFDYRFRNWGSAFIGFRYLDIDFDNESSRMDQYGFDGEQQGPTIGLNLYF